MAKGGATEVAADIQFMKDDAVHWCLQTAPFLPNASPIERRLARDKFKAEALAIDQLINVDAESDVSEDLEFYRRHWRAPP